MSTVTVDSLAKHFGIPADMLHAMKIVGREAVDEVEKIGGDPTQFTAISGRQYRLVGVYQWNDYQAEAVQSIVMGILNRSPISEPIGEPDDSPDNAAPDSEPDDTGISVTPQKISFDAEVFLQLLINNREVHRFFAHMYLPSDEQVFNPATVEARIEDMRSLTYGQKIGAIYRFFTSGMSWVTAVIRAYFLPMVSEVMLGAQSLGGASALRPSGRA